MLVVIGGRSEFAQDPGPSREPLSTTVEFLAD